MAKEEKKSFVVYLDWFDALEEYTDAEVGQLMRALAKYVRTGEKPIFSDRGMRGNFRGQSRGRGAGRFGAADRTGIFSMSRFPLSRRR